MKVLIFSAFVVILLAFNTEGAVFQWLPNPKEVCIDGVCEKYCIVDEYIIKPGQSVKTKYCSQLYCNLDFSGRGESCGLASMEGCKRLDHDFSYEYPDCCNRICVPEDPK